jgi:hypothetical protein
MGDFVLTNPILPHRYSDYEFVSGEIPHRRYRYWSRMVGSAGPSRASRSGGVWAVATARQQTS